MIIYSSSLFILMKTCFNFSLWDTKGRDFTGHVIFFNKLRVLARDRGGGASGAARELVLCSASCVTLLYRVYSIWRLILAEFYN